MTRAADPTGQAERVTQTLLVETIEGIPGNCMQAAVASLFEMRLEAVPHFVLFDDWHAAFRLWLTGIGLEWVTVKPAGAAIDGPYLAVGRSPRGFGHVCVAKDGAVIWDPHPSRDGLTSVDELWVFEPSNGSARV